MRSPSGVRRSGLVAAVALAAVTALLASARAANPAQGTLSPASGAVRWSGGPLTGTSGASPCLPPACDSFTLKSTLPASQWHASGGGIMMRIDWSDANSELDLSVLDASGRTIAASADGGVRSQQVFLAAPEPGTYQVLVAASPATAMSYRGAAWALTQRDPSAPSVAQGPMRFGAPSLVDPQLLAGEPGLAVGPDGRMYVSAPWGIQSATSLVWRSDDGGRRFVRRDGRLVSSAGDPTGRSCAEAEGGADADLAVDRNGRLYVADLGLLSVSAWASVDHGDTWTCETAAGSGINDDRPWVTAAPTADGSGPQIDAYLAYLTNSLTGQAPGGASFTPAGIRIDVTRDGGRTWTQRASYGRGLLPTTGPIFTAADGTVYEVFAGQESVWIARSRDQGRSFAVKRVALRAGSPANTFVSGAVDAAGNVYAAWVDYGTFDVVLSRSTDNGEHWSLPRRLNPPASETAVMPWVAAGRNGDVAVAWYGAAADARPDAVPATTPWNVWVARTLDATSAEPSFRVDVVTETPMHFGVICLRALQCTGDSNLADFFEIAIDRSGAVVAVFDDNAPGGGSLPDSPGVPFVTAARQVSGLGMTPAAPPGPAPSAGRDPVPEATFASMPSVSTSGKTLRLTFALRSAKNLTGALAASDTGAATDAYWIAVWKAAGKVEYAGMHMDRTGTAGFFGGDACAYVFRNSAGWTTYPATFTLAGRVDKGAGTVTIDVPLAAYHLKAGDLLHGLQAFSLTGSVPSTVAPLHLSDSTPAWTAQL